MTAINTEILANPASVREGVHYLKKVSHANRDAATALHKARSDSESAWDGTAADAFRDKARHDGHGIDELARITDKVVRGLESFADDIATAKSRMENARQVAQAGGLSVRGWWIEKPPGDVTQGASEGAGSPSMPGLNPKHHAQKEAEAKLDAWEEAQSLVRWARNFERTAHEELNSHLADANNLMAALVKTSTMIGNSIAVIGALHGAAKKLHAMADEQLGFVKQFERLSADSTLPAATREAHIEKMMKNIGITREQAASNAGVLGNAGNTKAGDLVFNPLTKTFGGTKPGAARALGRMGTVAGAVFTGVESGRQIIFDGKPAGKTLATNYASWGFGALTGGGAALGLSAAGLSGGPVTLAGVGIGIGASTAYGYFQDNTMEDFQHDSQEVGKEALERHADSQEQMRRVEQKHPGSVPSSKW